MLRAWWKFNHPNKDEVAVGQYKITCMDWKTIKSIMPLDPDKWKYISTYFYTFGSRHGNQHLVYNPTKNWSRCAPGRTYEHNTFYESEKMVIIKLSFFDYLKFRKYQKVRKQFAQQEEKREKLKADNEIKRMILEQAQKDITRMRKMAAKEIEKSAEYMRAAATSQPKATKLEPIDPDTVVTPRTSEEITKILAIDFDRYHPGYYAHWQEEQEKLKTAVPQSEIDRLANGLITLSQTAGASYIDSFTFH